MKSLKRLWMAVLLGVLLMTTLVGVAGARPNARPQQQAWRVLAVNGGAFTPQSWDEGMWSKSSAISAMAGPGFVHCRFVAPVDFPAAGEQAVGAVSVKRVTLYGVDGNANYNSCVTLRWSHPGGGDKKMAWVCTDYSISLGAWVDTSIDNNPVYRVTAPYLLLDLWPSGINAEMYVTGVFIHYTWM